MFCVPVPGDLRDHTTSSSLTSPAIRSSMDSTFALLPHGTSCIGNGAFGTVRVGWLQERKHLRQCSNAHTSEETILLGTCAAVAVKRVAVPDAVNHTDENNNNNNNDKRSVSHRQELLLRELQVMEWIRKHPHPNIVQCWGFLFGEKNKSAEGQFLTCDTVVDVEKGYTSGMILTTLEKERKRLESRDKEETNDESVRLNNDVLDNQILNSASFVDLCLSLCSSGSLGDYVHGKVNEALRASTQSVPSASSTRIVDCDITVTDKMSTTQGLTESTSGSDIGKGTGNPSLCTVASVGYSSKRGINTLAQCVLKVENVGEGSEMRHTTTAEPISVELVVRERDIVAITYALTNALRHTHETLRTLHRDVKPANVLLCSGVGKSPVYTLQPLSDASQTSLENTTPLTDTAPVLKQEKPVESARGLRTDDSVELILFLNSPETADRNTSPHGGNAENVSATTEETLAALVVPLEAGGQRLQCTGDFSRGMTIEYMPQSEAWRIQLADFGIATGVGHLTGQNHCGTFPFMAPEVAGAVNQYTTAADIYSLGVTLQYLLVHLVVESGEVCRISQRRLQALGALWLDQEDTENRIETETEADVDRTESRSHFMVPNAWRCARELDGGLFIRTSSPLVEGNTNADPGVGVNRHPGDDTRRSFAIPRSWRCDVELLEQRYIRHEPTSESGSSATTHHEYLLFPLPNNSNDGEAFEPKKGRRSRCKSCGRLHRHLIELLNAMTATQPSQRPPLSTVLQSAAIIEQGTFVQNTVRGGTGKCDETVLPTASTGNEITVNRFLRARQRAQEKERERRRIAASMSTFRFDMTSPNPQEQQQEEEKRMYRGNKESRDAADDAASTVLIWRPPSLRFLRASHEQSRESQ